MEGEQTEIDIKQLLLLRDGKRYDWASKAVILGGEGVWGLGFWFGLRFFFLKNTLVTDVISHMVLEMFELHIFEVFQVIV